MPSDREERLGELVSEHSASSGFMRGWPAFISAAVLSFVFVAGFLYWAASSDGFSFRIAMGALLMGVFGYGFLRTGLDGMRSKAWLFDYGMIVQSPDAKLLFCWDDVDEWRVHVVPGMRKRYEEDFGNVIKLTVVAGGEQVDVVDQLTDFRDLHDALEECVEAPRKVIRHERRPMPWE